MCVVLGARRVPGNEDHAHTRCESSVKGHAVPGITNISSSTEIAPSTDVRRAGSYWSLTTKTSLRRLVSAQLNVPLVQPNWPPAFVVHA